jgi:hypothetical protein
MRHKFIELYLQGGFSIREVRKKLILKLNSLVEEKLHTNFNVKNLKPYPIIFYRRQINAKSTIAPPNR